MSEEVKTLPTVTDVKVTLASKRERAKGLLAYVSCTFAGVMRLDGITFRRSLDGKPYLTFPGRRNKLGACYPYFQLADDEALRELELAVADAFVQASGGE